MKRLTKALKRAIQTHNSRQTVKAARRLSRGLKYGGLTR